MNIRVAGLLAALIGAGATCVPASNAAEVDAALSIALAPSQELVRGPGRAIAAFCQAAQQGNPDAAYTVAWAFLNGAGIRRDVANGTAWLRVAAAKGHAAAARWLVVVGDLTKLRVPHCRVTLNTTVTRAQPPAPMLALINQAAAEFDIDPNLVVAVMATESAFQPNAVSPKNAKGLMQLTDDTARRFGVKDVFEPADNIRGGAQYLRWLLKYFEGDVSLALAGYNAGENAVVRHGGVPPYAETRAYLEKIGSRYPLPSLPR